MKVILQDVRLAFPTIWKPEQFNGTGDPKFNCAFLFPPDHPARKLLSDAIRAVAAEKWKDDAPGYLKALAADNKLCLVNGDRKAEYDGYPGNYYCNASNKARPSIKNRDKTPLVEADGKPYGGCYVNGIVEVWAQANAFGKRVNASLMGIQFVRDGDAFSGSGVAQEDDFEQLEVGAKAGGMDDDIDF